MMSPFSTAEGQGVPKFEIEVEAGPVWQSRNDVQIPNDASGTRFSLVDLSGSGPKPAGRAYLTWNINRRHSLRALLAPLSFTETGTFAEPVDFAGESYEVGTPVDGTYKFNSWRLGYRYRFSDSEKLSLFVGFTAKIRDAKIELSQAGTASKKTDIGFVPLLNFGADWNFTHAWSLLFDFDGLAGGPGRAFDVALKLGYDLGDRWRIAAGYRTVEGGADVESVYNFAWLHYGVASVAIRF
jgi:hypothetical protein